MARKFFTISFPTLVCEERGFEALTGTSQTFYYIGKKKLKITDEQLCSLQVQGVPVKIHSSS